MRFIFSGGGTGGHIYPAITLIDNIKQRHPSAQILYVGTKNGLEADIIPKEDIPFVTINIEGFARRATIKNLAVAAKALWSLCKAYRIIKKFNPDAVIGTGGYVSGPILLTAALLKIPTLVQDQNAIPGITNKILAKFVTKIACGYESACQHFPTAKTVLTGNPIRHSVLEYSRCAAAKALQLDENKKTILVTGGSRGARRINEAMVSVYKYFINDPSVQFLHITGKTEYDRVIQNLKKNNIDIKTANNIFIKPYLYNMPKALAAADIAVSRAGAIGLSEITACGIPSILIPYPYAAENHQEFNAQALVKHDAAVMILNSELTGKRLLNELQKLLASPKHLTAMSVNSKAMGHPEAAKTIVDIIFSIIKNKK
ncbi:undecaprenyldiphospho-muramoylpentapeptide beta-N-acetylglucosaminyltransferase [Pectinatus frisingensis]|uniref:undecaprenyldiphospho-muramoylpentapeptide beta-N-acetylglucosaminyltransferase n=1 Tax=Pectinatus frisingensis TaxID=865 RepID=UPI0018C5A310|nr:undecaprenyldiphospho-muramoylpentapeptide beta-N-acetylglucosaminyltransferase [Pectinatus frisingensis]